MYLLKPYCFLQSASQKNRFTFHYVSIKTAKQAQIYKEVYIFTFHYVSIKTVESNKLDILAIEFTFHYVSIKTRGLK